MRLKRKDPGEILEEDGRERQRIDKNERRKERTF